MSSLHNMGKRPNLGPQSVAEELKGFQRQGALPHDPLTRGSAPGLHWSL